MHSPVPFITNEGNNQIVSADAVAVIIEVKSVLNKAQLDNAYKKIEEVKRLKKSQITDMDQKATASSLTTIGTLGVILGFGTDISLDKLAEHCLEFNERYENTHRPDLIVASMSESSITWRNSLVCGRPVIWRQQPAKTHLFRLVLSTWSHAPTAPTHSTGYLRT